LRGGCIYLVFKGVVFSENEKGRGGQVVVGPSKRGFFGVKSFYSVMGCNDGFRFPWKNVWQNKVPLRVAFFV